MKSKYILLLITNVLFSLIFLSSPQATAHAQEGGCGFNNDGSVIPCPENEEKKTVTPVPPTFTFTPTETPTQTATNAPTLTATATEIPNTATPTLTPTATITPSPTPVPIAKSALPGAGIGAFILFLIIGLLLPAIQKIRVAKRGY